jgi:hypothetical protein
VIPAILSMLTALFGVVGKVFEWLYARDLTDAGKVQAELEALRKQVHDAQVAVAAREAVRAAAAAAGDGGVSIDESDPNLRD